MSELEPQQTRTPRPRQQVKSIAAAATDPMEYKQNRCTDRARKMDDFDDRLKTKFWCDKHYFDRIQHGDENGARDGIDIDTVKSLVRESLKHLLAHSSIVKGFTFLNYSPDGTKITRPTRVVCQKMIGDSMLNVIIEAHFINFNEYELTVITAMKQDNFDTGDGQYSLEIVDFDRSILNKLVNKRVEKINEI